MAYDKNGAEVVATRKLSIEVDKDTVFEVKYTGNRQALPGSTVAISQVE